MFTEINIYGFLIKNKKFVPCFIWKERGVNTERRDD
jgi:hypothetical protein